MISAASLHDLHDLFCSVFVRSPAGADSINMRQLLPLILTLFALHQYEMQKRNEKTITMSFLHGVSQKADY
nr:PREDICTED: uncharacterized protein LOC109037214 isoform X2 [Bemisia tabaci]